MTQNQRNKQPIKNRQNWTDIFPKIYRWPTGTREDAQHCQYLEKCRWNLQWVTITHQLEWISTNTGNKCWRGCGEKRTLRHHWDMCVLQSCPTVCKPMGCSLPSSSVHEIFQATVLEWIAISFSRINYLHIHVYTANIYWVLCAYYLTTTLWGRSHFSL